MTPTPPQGDARVTVPREDAIKRAIMLSNRRDALGLCVPKCLKCGHIQIQLVRADIVPAEWKCRICKHAFLFEPDAQHFIHARNGTAAPQTHSTDDEVGVLAEWLQELSSGANCGDKGDGWKLTTHGKIERDKSRRRLSILRSLLSRLPSAEATEEDVLAALGPNNVWKRVIEDLAKAGLRITRTPGGQT